jgi:hypothetical protein
LLRESKKQLSDSLPAVRRALSPATRRTAFTQVIKAFTIHEHLALRAELADSVVSLASSGGLYHQENPSKILARTMLRELAAWPKDQPGWLERFAELERHLS